MFLKHETEKCLHLLEKLDIKCCISRITRLQDCPRFQYMKSDSNCILPDFQKLANTYMQQFKYTVNYGLWEMHYNEHRQNLGFMTNVTEPTECLRCWPEPYLLQARITYLFHCHPTATMRLTLHRESLPLLCTAQFRCRTSSGSRCAWRHTE